MNLLFTNSLRVLCGASIAALVMMASPVRGSEFTVQDILDGISARHSSIRNAEMEYTIAEENFPAYYAMQERQFQLLTEFAKKDPSIHPEQAFFAPEGRTQEKNREARIHLISDGNSRAFETFDKKADKESPISRGTYNGEVLRALDVPSKKGVIQRVTSDDAMRFLTIPKLLGINRIGIFEYIKASKLDLRVDSSEQQGTDLLVTLSASRIHVPDPTHPQATITTEFKIVVNASKSFWPQEILQTIVLKGIPGAAPGERRLLAKTSVEGYWQSSNIFYPKKIVTEWFENDGHGSLPSGKRVTQITKVQINGSLPSSTFDFGFPNGTVLFDDLVHVGYTVGAPVSQLSAKMHDSISGLPISQYTREQAVAYEAKSDGKFSPDLDVPQGVGKRPTPITAVAVKDIEHSSMSLPAYLFLGAGTIVIVATCIWIFRRRVAK